MISFMHSIMWLLKRISSFLFSPVAEQQDIFHSSYEPEHLASVNSSSDVDHPRPSLHTSVNSSVDMDHLRQRTERKLKGYFSLAKIEIDKALRFDEREVVAEAIKHYQAACTILREGASTPVISQSELATMYLEKMYKWQKEVDDRLKVLSLRLLSQSNHANRRESLHAKHPKTTGLSRSSSLIGSLSPSKKNASNAIKKAGLPRLSSSLGAKGSSSSSSSSEEVLAPRGIDPKLAKIIEDEIVDRTPAVRWDSVAGLEKAKQALMEMVILPIRRSDLFSGLRNPARGLLLFGPPGNGKTLLAKAVAYESSATFFCIGASSLTSKWVGEGEKLVRTLFAIARARQPSVVFIDEIDSIMSTRSSNEHESSRRLKSEFLVQFDGVMSSKDDRVVVMGATNRPQDIDDAVRRRLVKRIYIPLPDLSTRKDLLSKVLRGNAYSLPSLDVERIAESSDGYSGSDLYSLCQEAAMMPIRELGTRVNTVRADQVRALAYRDFEAAMTVIRPSVSRNQLRQFEDWNEEFGSK